MGILIACTFFGLRLRAQTGADHWVVTWAGAPQAYVAPPFWQFGWPFQDAIMATGILEDQTLRTMVHTTIGGRQVRVRLTNRHGNVALRIASAHVGILPASADEPLGQSILQGTDRRLTFSGTQGLTIPPGQTITSDPVDLVAPPKSNLVMTLYLPERTPVVTTHYSGKGFSYVSGKGDYSEDVVTPTNGFRFGTVPWLSAVEVLAPQSAAAVVVLTDDVNTVSRNQFWDRLAARLSENPQTADTAVVAIGDNLASFANNSRSPSILLDRLDRDVLSLAGVRWVVLRPFIDEILYGPLPRNASSKVTPENIEPTLRQIVEKAHAAGVKVIGGTITPFPGSSTYSQEAEATRQSINDRLRAGGIFDSLIDFDRIVRDPQRPERFLPQYLTDSGIYAIPAMSDAIDLSIFANANRQ